MYLKEGEEEEEEATPDVLEGRRKMYKAGSPDM